MRNDPRLCQLVPGWRAPPAGLAQGKCQVLTFLLQQQAEAAQPVDRRTQYYVTEARPVQSQFSVSNVTDDQITLLVRDRAISPEVQALLRQVIERKNAIAALQAQITAREQEIGSIGRDQDRVRGNMQALKGSSEEKQLLQRYVKQLDDQENRLAVLRKEVNDLTADRNRADADLSTFIQGLSAGGT